MKKKNRHFIKASLFTAILLTVAFILNLRVSYYQAINYNVRIVRIPLYLKIIDLFSRHYHYRELVQEITAASKDEEEKAIALFKWIYRNIRKVPADFPVIDDHLWHIIIRGYGTDDQSADVFSTLCNYAGIESFFAWPDLLTKEENKKICLSFVKLKGKWCIFDPYRGVYFTDKDGKPAGIEAIKNNVYFLQCLTVMPAIDYSDYLQGLISININNPGLRKSNIQSPLTRLLFEIQKWKR